MSMFNDIEWKNEGNKDVCVKNFTSVSEYAKTNPHGHLSFLGPRSEQKWYVTNAYKPEGRWDKVADDMMPNFAESGHPTFRGTSVFERGTVNSKGGGKSSIHFCGYSETIEVIFRTIISANPLSVYGAVADMCEESILLFSEVSASAGKLVAKVEPEAVVPLPDVTNSRPTNESARGDALCKYKQKIDDFLQDLRIEKCVPKQVSCKLLSQDKTL